MSTFAALIGLLIAALLWNVWMTGQSRRLLLPSGSEWIIVGFAVGPIGFGLLGATDLATVAPVLEFGIGWLGLTAGMAVGSQTHRPHTRLRVAGPFVALAGAALTYGGLRWGLPLILGPAAEVWALPLAVLGTSGSPLALRWIGRFRRVEHPQAPRTTMLVSIARWDNAAAILGIVILYVWLEAPRIGVLKTAVASIAAGATLGLLAAVLIRGPFDRVAAWGTLLGAALLAAGIAMRLEQPPVAALAALGMAVTSRSSHRKRLHNMVAPTESPCMIAVLLTAGSAIEPATLAAAPVLAPAFLAVRSVARWAAAVPLVWISKARSIHWGAATWGVGPLAIALALHLLLLDTSNTDHRLLLGVVAMTAVVSEVFAPIVLHRMLLRVGEVQRRAVADEDERFTDSAWVEMPLPTDSGSAESEPHAISWRETAVALGILVALYAVLYLAVQLSRDAGGYAPATAGLGFLILSGTLAGRIVATFGLPRVTGYLIAGLAAGPHGFALVERDSVDDLTIVNGLALGLLALEAGAELTVAMLRRDGRSLTIGTITQIIAMAVVLTGAVVMLSPWIPFLSGLDTLQVAGIGLLWAITAVSMSPAAALAVLAESDSRGPVARISLGIIVVVEVVALALFALALPLARGLLESSFTLPLDEIAHVGRELLGSVAIGTTLGLLLAGSMAVIRQRLPMFVILAFFGYEFSSHLGFDPLIMFLAAGFVVRNLTPFGRSLLETMQRSAVVMVIFFAAAGASMDVPSILALWPLVLALGVIRIGTLAGAGIVGGRLAGESPETRRWAWTGFVTQGVLAVALALMVERALPAYGAAFRSLVLAVLGLNLLVGPVLYKIGLTRAAKTSTNDGAT